MKCVDSNFKVISNNDDKFYIDELLGHIEEAIISSECDKQIVDDVLRESDNIVIQITDGKQYSIV